MKATRASLLVAAVLGLALVFLINYLSFRHYKRWDWTGEGWFTLSERTREVLTRLDQDVDIYLLLAAGEMDFADLDNLLEEYKAQSPRIRIERVDPDRDRARYEILAQQFGIPTLSTDIGVLSQIPVVVTIGERKWKIERDDLIIENFDSFDDVDGPRINIQSERAVTGAILEVLSDRQTKVCVTQEHGEWQLSGSDERTLGRLVEEAEWEKIKVERIELLGGQQVPKDCDALLVVGPQRAFAESEVNAFDTYLKGGGDLLLALDPVIDRDQIKLTGFEAWLSDLGIELGRDVVLEFEPTRVLPPGSIDAFIATDFRDHRLTETIRQRGGGAAFALARSVRPLEGSKAEVLMATSPKSYAEDNLKSLLKAAGQGDPLDDRPLEPVPLAVALESNKDRLIVMGDADWLQGVFLDEVQLSNIDLLSAVLGWLVDRDALITIAPREANAQSVMMTEGDLSNLFFRVVVLLPAGFFMLGLGVWWSRRS